jgi:hypothetical protein
MNGGGLEIGRLELRLPAGLAHRADAIARETARQLAALPLPPGADRRLASLEVPAVRIQGGESNRVIAARIARGIHNQLQRPAVAGVEQRS